MTAPHSRSPASPGLFVLVGVFLWMLFWLLTVKDTTNSPTEGVGQRIRHSITHKRQQLVSALDGLREGQMPARLKELRKSQELVGEHLSKISHGKETVEEVLHGHKSNSLLDTHDLPPMTVEEVQDYLTNWIHQLHNKMMDAKHETYQGIWQTYHDLAVKTLYPWDREYLQRMPQRRDDDSVFLSLATYRDENCLNTVKNAFGKSKNPDKLFVGLVQQNCEKDCRSGVLEGGKVEDVPPDDDCHKLFCESEEGKRLCANGNVRALHIQESESLGPYAARYFASKLWHGESWFMQTDAHMTFKQNWDWDSVQMLKKAPSKKPVLSHYPPGHTANLEKMATSPASRLCGPVFATSDLESQIIRLEGAGKFDQKQTVPRFAPFTAAGYFVAHANFLREVPFDPFLPWIFMGEEIIMSTRLWTAGYDIFSPTFSVVGHIYVRRHKPKFWESVHRAFTPGVHNPLQAMILNRVKYQLGYPEAAKDMILPKSLLTAVEQYTMGTERPLSEYLKIVGLNMTTKEVTYTAWCETGKPPPGFEEFNDLYE